MSTNCNKLQNSPNHETIKIAIPSPDHEILPQNHEILPQIHEILPQKHEIRSESHEIRGDSDRREEEEEEEENNSKINDGEENCEAKTSTRESEISVPEEEDDDGFRTPTSIDHKIPAITRCPSPPRKSSRPQLKRRAPPESCRRRLRFVAAAEVESVLWPMIGENVEEKRSKKARTTASGEI